MKMLWSPKGEGLQALHYDVNARSLAYSRYSCILYCTRSHHTAMPNAPAASLRRAFLTGENLNTTQLAANTALFDRVPFVSEIVPAGSGMVFGGGVAHHGVKNVTEYDRILVFALFCPRLDKNADLVRRFPLGTTPLPQED